jgi:hypothetical protein
LRLLLLLQVMAITGVLVHFGGVPPPLAIFGGAALCFGLFVLDLPGAHGNWCHVPKFGDFAMQDASVCSA